MQAATRLQDRKANQRPAAGDERHFPGEEGAGEGVEKGVKHAFSCRVLKKLHIKLGAMWPWQRWRGLGGRSQGLRKRKKKQHPN